MGQKDPTKVKEETKAEMLQPANLSDFKTSFVVEHRGAKANLSEGFEGTTFPPDGWTVINGGDANTWIRSTSTPISGTASARITYSSTAHNDWLITPRLAPVDGNNTISFKAKNQSVSYLEAFNVKLSTTGKAEEDFTISLATEIEPPITPATYTYDLSAYNGQLVYVAVQAISTDMWNLYLDDFSGCTIYVPPTDLVVTGLNKDYRLIPLSQLNSEFYFKTKVRNIGTELNEAVDATAELKNSEDAVVYTSTDAVTIPLAMAAEQTVTSASPFDFSVLEIGNYTLTHTVPFASDNDLVDNTDVFSFDVNEYIFARDAGTLAATGVGSSSSAITFGLPYTIVNECVMSGVQIQWPTTVASNLAFTVALYAVDGSNNVTSTIFTSGTLNRLVADAGTSVNFPVRPVTLAEGTYMLCVKQLTATNIGIGYDSKPYGALYIANNAATPTSFAANTSFGNISLRMDVTPKSIVTFNVADEGSVAINGASITVMQGETTVATATTAAGTAEVWVADGEYTYTVSAVGYITQTDVPVTIAGNQTVDITMMAAPPALGVTPSPYEYASTHIDASVSNTFTIQNIGAGTLTVNPGDITLVGDNADEFVLTTLSDVASLGMGATATFSVAFTPTSVGEKTATIQIEDNLGKGVHEVVITGTAYDATINTFPYTQSFDEETFPAFGWASARLTGTSNPGTWLRVTSGTNPTCSPQAGAAMIKYSSYTWNSAHSAMLATPRIDFDDQTYGVTFWMYRDNGYSTSADKVEVYINTQQNLTGAVLLGTVNRSRSLAPVVAADGWYKYGFTIPDGYSELYPYIILKAISAYGNHMYADEMTIENFYNLALVSNPELGGVLTGAGAYGLGQVVAVNAVSNAGYRFVNWTNESAEVVSAAAAFNYTVTAEDVSLTANFATAYDATFTVTDQAAAALAGVSIAYTGEMTDYPGIIASGTLTTGAGGIATVQLPKGSYTYTATKANYYEVTGTITVVDGVVNEPVSMQIFPLITMNVTDGTKAVVSGVTISIEGQVDLTTDGAGSVSVRLPNGVYTGTAYKVGHAEVAVEFTVADNADMTVDIVLPTIPPTFEYTQEWTGGAEFATVLGGVNTSTITFQFSNIGTGDLTVNMNDFSLSGDDAFVFGADYSGVVHTLAVGQTASFIIKFQPATGGIYTGQLTYAPAKENIVIDLSGEAYDPTTTPFVEDFESGNFNNWIVANGTETNQWFVGTAAADPDNLSAMISNDGGVTNAYTLSGTPDPTSVVHFYMDFAIPTVTDGVIGDVVLAFDWKGIGEGGTWDVLRVFNALPTTSVNAGLGLAGQIGTYHGQATWQTVKYNVPVEHFGTTRRIVFSWKNDETLGSNPPIAVDNIKLVESREITAVAAVENITVPYLTELAGVNLPETVMVDLDGEYFGATSIELDINWDGGAPAYEGAVAGDYVFTGTLVLEPGILNAAAHNVTLTVTVEKGNPVVTTWPVALNEITYGATLADADLTGVTEVDVVGAFSYVDANIVPEYVDGGYEAAVVFIPTDTDNYNNVEGTVLVTVNKLDITFEGAMAHDKVYDGTADAVVTGGALVGVLAADSENVMVDAGATIWGQFVDAENEVTVVVGTNINVVTPTLTITGAAAHNYNLILPDYLIADITEKELTVINAVAQNKVYDKTTVAVVTGAELDGVVGTDDVVLENATEGVFEQATIGTDLEVTVAMTLVGADIGNYTLTQPDYLIADITAKELTVANAVASDKVYDRNNVAEITGAELVGVVEGDDVVLENAATGTFPQFTAGTDLAVTTSMYISGADAPNYNLTQPDYLVADINKMAITITADDQIKKAGTVFTFEGDEFTVNPATIDPDAVTSVTLASDGAAGDALANEDPGYEITVSDAVGVGLDNYEITYVSGNMIVTDKIILTLPDLTVADKVYDGTRTATVTTWGALAGDFDPENNDVDYDATAAVAQFATAGAGVNKTVSITGVVLTGTDAALYKLATLTPTATISQKGLDITAENKTKVYGNTDPALTVTYSGFVTGQNQNNLSGALVIEREAGEDVANYAITPSGYTSANYAINYVPGVFAITQRMLTVAADAKSKVYGEADPALTYQITSGTLAFADAFDGALIREVGEGIGTREIQQGTLTIVAGVDDVMSNYDFTYTPANLTIDAKELTVINAVAQSKVYDKTDAAVITGAELSGVVTGDDVTLVNGNVGTFAQATVGTDIPVAINMSITGDIANYTFTQPTGLTADITAKPLAVINAVAEDKLYDGTTAAVITGAELDAVIEGDVVVLDNAAVGTFAQATIGIDVAVTTAMAISGADAANYELSAQPAGLMADITAVELTIGGSFTASDKLFDGTVAATIDATGLTLVGVADGETVTLVDVVAEFASAAVATDVVVSIVSAGIDGATAGNYTLSLVGAPTATADIYNEFALTLVANPIEGGTINNVAGNYQPGAEISLIANPAAGYEFVNWTNVATVVSTDASFTFTMPTEDVTLTANFNLIPVYNVTFSVADAGSNVIAGAAIVINGQNLVTDAAGVATISLMDGNYAYTVTAADFEDFAGNLTVAGADLPVAVVMNDVIVAPFNPVVAVTGNDALLTWNNELFSFTDDMESHENFIIENIGEYSMIDGDGKNTYGVTGVTFPNSGYTGSYIVFNPSATTPPLTGAAWQPHGGSKYLACLAAIPSPTNNDWLILPQVLGLNGMQLSFWAKSITDQYGLERFRVLVSNSGMEQADFMAITTGSYVEAPTAWTQYTYDLSAYAGQNIYIAIQCISNDAFAFFVDDLALNVIETSKAFMGYTVYLNDEVVATGVTDLQYQFEDVPAGTHIAGVQAVYSSGASEIVTAEFTVFPSDFPVTFTVTAAGAPLEGAVVTMNSVEATTDASGVAVINVPNGTYSYTIAKLGYQNVTGSVVINNAAGEVAATMVLAPFATTFNATSNGAPLAGVTIIINSTQILTTNAQGTVVANLVNGEYSYLATKTGYDQVTGNFTVNNATQTITILMEVGIDGIAENYVRLYPNPAADVLNIERNSSEEVVVELYSNSGALINSFKTENVTTTFDVSTLGSGSYYIRVIGTNSTTIHRFIKQ